MPRGSPVVVQVGQMPYPVMNTLLDGGYPAGMLNYWLSSFTQGLPDELIDAMVERFASVPSPMTAILLEQDGDAVRAAYGPNYDRLPAVERRVDPQNVFHHNHNINPG